jgi:hypothetical protein
MIHAFTFPPYDGRGPTGFCHLFAHPTSLLNQGHGPSLWSNMLRDFQQRISIASPGASGSGGLRHLS